jgi:hypothetical protein
MRKITWIVVLIGVFLLSACQNNTTEEEIIIPSCQTTFTYTLGEDIPIDSLSILFSTVIGNQSNFINPCKPFDINPLTLTQSSIKTHQVILNFDAIYPIDHMQIISNVSQLSLEVSLDGVSFRRVINQETIENNQLHLGGTMAKSIKLVIPVTDENTTLEDIRFTLGDGLIIMEDEDLTRQFLRYQGWTGADGIFSFNLTNGDETIGADKSNIGFVFSDTFVGEVYTNNNLRKSSVMINNSLGYMNPNLPIDEAFSFDYRMIDGLPSSPFIPDAYIGLVPRNLLDGDGLSISQSKDSTLTNSSEGLSYRANQPQAELIIDLKDPFDLGSITLWNDNSNPSMGTKTLGISYSLDNLNFTDPITYQLNQASGSQEEPYTLDISDINTSARYIKLELLESYDQNVVGLGKLMLFDTQGRFLFGDITGTSAVSTLHTNELSARLWLQDGVVVDQKLYLFPILVKDEGEIFKVHNVGLIESPIVDGKIAYDKASYYSTPLQTKTSDGGTLFFGAGLLNNVSRDGYIYIYGYKDLNGRHLIVGRFLPEDILNFNRWTYFNGETFVSDINEVAPLIEGVSAELSVTYIPSGAFEGKYMLTVMENTTSGKISYALSDTPYGSFSDYTQIYQTDVSHLRAAFTYNAKMHPVLSKPGEYIISYNVNTTLVGALSDANIYYPRFIKIIEVKK